MISKFIKTSEQCQQAIEAALRNHDAFIHNLENQMGQIAKMLLERSQGTLPGNTKMNPKEQVKTITLRIGRELQSNKCGKPPVAIKEDQTAIVVKSLMAKYRRSWLILKLRTMLCQKQNL